MLLNMLLTLLGQRILIVFARFQKNYYLCNLVVNNYEKGENILVEVELKLSNFIKHKHPIETVDYIICWNIDLEEKHIQKVNESNCILINSDNEYKYLAFDEKELKIIELKSVVKKILHTTRITNY